MADLTQTIDSDDAVFQTIAGDVQANILRSHGRDNAAHIFVRFPPSGAAGNFLPPLVNRVTSAAEQRAQSQRKKDGQEADELCIGLALSAAGYAELGHTPPRRRGAFAAGMAKGFAEANFVGSNTSEAFAGDPWHAVITAASDDTDQLSNFVDETLKEAVSLGFDEPHVEVGLWESDERIEHFGYPDGKSQPLLLADEASFETWNERYRLGQALVEDHSGDPETSYGSFLVFWKLEQHVDKFTKEVGTEGDAGNRLVGRTRRGEPLAAPGTGASNDFDYSYDLGGDRCPVDSHIRKVNPRRGSDRKAQLVRRGIPYGRRDSNDERGLLFVAFCRNIEGQFELMARNWLAAGFPRRNTGPDVLLSEFVTVRGGEYFFAPSLSSLKQIGYDNENINEISSLEESL